MQKSRANFKDHWSTPFNDSIYYWPILYKKKTVKNASRSGWPHVLSKTDERFIIRLIKKDPKISVPTITATMEQRVVYIALNTIRHMLRNNNYHGRTMRKKFWVNQTNREKRLKFAKKTLK